MAEPRDAVLPVVLSGGSGTRLWPVSRESFPKQFWPLLGARTLIAETLARALGQGFAPAIVVCNEEHRFLVAEEARATGVTDARIVLEPVGRNSAPAVAAAAVLAAAEDADRVLWVMAADAAIGDPAALRAALDQAAAAARAGRIVTFGMPPDGPETAFGYIERGDALPDLPGAFAVRQFVEKPDAGRAEALIAAGCLWNSGMVVASAATVLDALARHAPDVLDGARRAVAEATRDLDFIRLGAAFAAAPAISLDHAVLERTDRAAVVPARLGWADIGSWGALWALGAKDAAGNVAVGDVLIEGARDCYVRSDGVLTAVVGLEGVVVVVTEDAVLAMPRGRAQDVRRVVDRLRAAGRREAVAHNRAYRPWGHADVLIRDAGLQVRRVVVEPGKRLSLQRHRTRSEHWVVVEGAALVTLGGSRLVVAANESVPLPIGMPHRLENPGPGRLTLIEVQAGGSLGDDDVERLDGPGAG